ncbi:hypothetical protein LOTGIDRAFT_239747 [Lottia gigantea]|uniref:SAM domain-containing protein n=1 Tax=Lottia gigantea TaxID=225164 RepID=V4C592_LOTGI|nr:hypothetical protein LOTGIDRAFT_239747 [Lottia gigantea]ESO96759.1 hypothetical protein LOTGIDRAFT_239747 [Lottia gigantea]
MKQNSNVVSWSCKEVEKWLKDNGFESYVPLLCDQHEFDGIALLTLTEDDLKKPPLNIQVLGHVKKLSLKLGLLRKQNSRVLQSLGIENIDQMIQNNHRKTLNSISSNASNSEDSDDSLIDKRRPQSKMRSKKLDPEIWKTALSFIYVFCVFLLTSFVMVIVHDRVPDMQKFPPLPDLFLDNMPYVPWAFKVCELVGLILGGCWFTLLFFHKHRFIIMRRFFSLAGTVFLLRSFTMLITSMSVPGVHLQCSGKRYGDIWTKLQRTFEIWKGLGMTLQGVRTCGDYMFSGHTVILTLLNFFITEYSSKTRMYYLHMVTWVLNLFGIFFILAAHEHYSIDVFVAFYLTSRLFMYYHTLANNRSLMQRDAKRTRIWFPLFAFFESKCDGVVPNEFEWPLPSWLCSFLC